MGQMQQWHKNLVFDTSNPTVAATATTLATGNPITTTTQTAIVLTAAGPINGVFIKCTNGSNVEPMLVVSGGGSVNLTVVRGPVPFTFTVAGTVVALPGYNTFTLQTIANVPNREVKGAKISTDINYQVILPAVGDGFQGGASSLILADTSPNLGTLNLLAPRGTRTWIQFASAGGTGPAGSGASPASLNITFAGGAATAGSVYSGSLIASGGVPPYAFTITAGALPTGLTLGAGTGSITGTITAAPGSYSFSGTVTDTAMTTATIACVIVVFAAPPVAVVTGVVGVDASTLLTSDPNYHPRWQDLAGGLHTVINLTITASTVGYATVWFNFGAGQVWQGWWDITASGQVISVGLQGTNNQMTYPPTLAAGSWTATVGGGEIPSAGPIPGGAVTSTAFTVPAPSTPSATAATDCFIHAITYSAGVGGANNWGWDNLLATLPYADPEFWYAEFTVQNGQYISSVWTPGGQHGGVETSFCQVGPTSVDSYYGPGGTTPNLVSLGSYEVSLFNLDVWTPPSDANTVFKFRCYVYSRLGTTSLASPGTGTLQNCWSSGVGVSTPGTASSQDVTIPSTNSAIASTSLSLDGTTIVINPNGTIASIAAPGANYLSNPGAENGLGWWSNPSAIPFISTTSQHHSGARSFSLASVSGAATSNLVSPQIPATPGQVYTANCWMLGDSVNSAELALNINFFNSSGGLISSTTVAVQVTSIPTSWTSLAGTQIQAPALTVTMELNVTVIVTGGTGNLYIDDLSLFLCTSSALLAAASVGAAQTNLAAINASTGALAAAAAVINLQQNGGSLAINNGINVFTGAVYLSQGTTEPVVALLNTGIFLYGVAGSGNTGLTSSPYVAIQSTGILVANSATGPSAYLNGTGLFLYAVTPGSPGSSSTSAYAELTSGGGLTIRSSQILGGTYNGYWLETDVSASGITLTFTNGSTINSQVSLTSTTLIMSYAGTTYLTMNSAGIAIANGSIILNLNNVTASISNGLDSAVSEYAGLKVLDNVNTWYTIVTPNGFFFVDATGAARAALQQDGANSGSIHVTSGTSQMKMTAALGAAAILANGSQVLTVRQTGPGSPSGFADSTAQAWCLSLYHSLSAAGGGHGLIS